MGSVAQPVSRRRRERDSQSEGTVYDTHLDDTHLEIAFLKTLERTALGNSELGARPPLLAYASDYE